MCFEFYVRHPEKEKNLRLTAYFTPHFLWYLVKETGVRKPQKNPTLSPSIYKTGMIVYSLGVTRRHDPQPLLLFLLPVRVLSNV